MSETARRRAKPGINPISSLLLISLYHVFLCIILTMIHARSIRDRILSYVSNRNMEIKNLVHSKKIKHKK